MLAYSGRARFVIEPLDLSLLTRETTALLQTVIGKGSTLQLELDPALPRILGDASQLRQVVMNLVMNAAEAMGEQGGVIQVRTQVGLGLTSDVGKTILSPGVPASDYVVLSVSDTGCGMSPETVRRIFEPFFTTKLTGRGLGLAAVLGIVRSLHGGLRVTSDPGRGTTFDVLLPRATSAESERSRVEDRLDAPIAGGTALVVDDDPQVLQVASRMLSALGFEVLLADAGHTISK
jgi:signal transduction histidine kinase